LGGAEKVAASRNAAHVDAQRGLEVLLDLAEHLEGVGNFDGVIFESEMAAERRYGADMDTGNGCGAEIDADTVGRTVGENGLKALFGSHGG